MPFILPTIEGRETLPEDIEGGAMDILLGLPADTEGFASIEEVLVPDALPEEVREPSCLVGDLLGD